MSVLRRGDWRVVFLLVAVALLITVLFAATGLDLVVARFFFRAEGSDHWPLAKHLPWMAIRTLTAYVTIPLLVVGLLGLLIGRAHRNEVWRLNSVFVILSVVIGPALVFNASFTDHWHRPGPRELLEFGGTQQYAPVPLRSEACESVANGEWPVAFLYASGWWIWRRRRPAWARASLALGLAGGFGLGIAYMAAGRYFLSDVLWSALLALGLAHAVYYCVLGLRSRAESLSNLDGPRARAPGMRMMAVLLIVAAFARWHQGGKFANCSEPPPLSQQSSLVR
jgi:lipid A 4'-phosphatase